MVGTNVKAETTGLMEKRAAMEAEMNTIVERLCQPGGPGLSGNLFDSEGFPRADIDIPVVRAERNRLAELRNDHKDITEKINANIQMLHSARVGAKSPTQESDLNEGMNRQISSAVNLTSAFTDGAPKDPPTSMDVDIIFNVPFAMVDEIADASPAAEDGLQLGDQIVKFGNVQAGDNLLQRLASEAQSNQDHKIPVVLLRQGAMLNLNLTPRAWQGRGLLGNLKSKLMLSIHLDSKSEIEGVTFE